jgi:hypothetical protein
MWTAAASAARRRFQTRPARAQFYNRAGKECSQLANNFDYCSIEECFQRIADSFLKSEARFVAQLSGAFRS